METTPKKTKGATIDLSDLTASELHWVVEAITYKANLMFHAPNGKRLRQIAQRFKRAELSATLKETR